MLSDESLKIKNFHKRWDWNEDSFEDIQKQGHKFLKISDKYIQSYNDYCRMWITLDIALHSFCGDL